MNYPRKIVKLNLLALILTLTFLGGSSVLAAGSASRSSSVGSATQAQSVSLSNPLGTSDFNTIAATIINGILGFVGTISLLLFIYGGLVLMTSAGASAKIDKGKNIILYAVIGMVIVFTSYILVKFVIQGITGV